MARAGRGRGPRAPETHRRAASRDPTPVAARHSPLGASSYPVLVAAATLVAYGGAFTTPFVFDDAEITDTAALHELSWGTVSGTTRPLVQLTLAANWAVHRLDVVGYHVVNIAIHVLAALVLYALVLRTLRTTASVGPTWRNTAPELAFTVSLLWAVHPLQTESVTYVMQRAESLMALCYLATVYAVVRGATSLRASRWYAAAIVACALGMLSKPVMVTAPLAVLLYDRAFLAGSWRRAWRQRRALYMGLAATELVLVLLLAGGAHESAATAGFGIRDVTFGEFARSQPGVVLHYLRLAFVPYGLVLDYAWPPATGVTGVLVPALVLAALVGGALWATRGNPAASALVALFLLMLAPSSSIVPIKDLAFEHRMYLPLAPLLALAVAGVFALIQRAGRRATVDRRLLLAAIAAVALVLIALTIDRNRDYRSPLSMWTDVVAKRPANARARSNRAQALMQERRVDEAAAELTTALQLDPTLADAHVNLGHALALRGAYADAAAHFAEALRLDPASAAAHNNWGDALADQGRFAEAEPHYAEALRRQFDYAEAHNNLGVALLRRGAFDDAAREFAAALRLKPRYAESHNNLGNLHARQGKAAEAVRDYERALAIEPSYAEVHFNLALALAATGRRDDARAHAAEAVRLKPSLESVVRQSGILTPP
jgi:tetratricopeptide (TPR) repeat protein